MTRNEALSFVSFTLDDSLNIRTGEPIPHTARLVGWQCGYEPLFVAVWSYLPNVRLGPNEAADIAKDFLLERNWFSDSTAPNNPDYIL